MSNRWLAALLVTTVTVACSSGDDDSTPATTATTDETAGDDAPSETTVATTTAPTTTAPTIPTTTTPPTTSDPQGDVSTGGSDPDSPWCVAARGVDNRLEALDDPTFDFTDTEQVEAAFSETVVALRDVQSLAPPEIADDVATTLRGFEQFDAALAAVGYDFLLADLTVIDDLDVEMSAAGDRIEAYNVEVCGFAPDGDDEDDDDSSFDPAAGSIRDQFVAELVGAGFTEDEAACIFDAIDFGDLDALDDDAVMAAVFDQCDISLTRLAELVG